MPGCCIRVLVLVLVLMPGSFLRFATLCNSTISARCPIKQNSLPKMTNFASPEGHWIRLSQAKVRKDVMLSQPTAVSIACFGLSVTEQVQFWTSLTDKSTADNKTASILYLLWLFSSPGAALCRRGSKRAKDQARVLCGFVLQGIVYASLCKCCCLQQWGLGYLYVSGQYLQVLLPLLDAAAIPSLL